MPFREVAFCERPAALPVEVVQALRTELLASPFVGRSPLAGTFRASRGFALVFRRDGLSELARRFPQLLPFVDEALEPEGWTALWRPADLLRRLGRHRPQPNAFYLNLLLVPEGAAVGPHIDATLRQHCGDDSAVPEVVSVLYLSVPATMRGGRLILRRDGRLLASITPREATLLHFRGDLSHEVEKVEAVGAEGMRMSLVCEQYALSPASLERLPRFAVHSKAGFGAYLAEAERRPSPDFVLD